MVNKGSGRIVTVAHYIPSLDMGGAERQLLELVKSIDKSKFKVLILTNHVGQCLRDEVSSIDGIRIITLDKDRASLYPLRLLQALWREKPLILNVYLVGAQLYTLLVRPFLSGMKLVFSVRDAADYRVYHGFKGKLFKILIEKCRPLVDFYLFNSEAGRKERAVIPDSKALVIPNGIDTNRFSPDIDARRSLRRELHVAENVPVIGVVANFSMYKGYDCFIRAARIVTDEFPDTCFVAVGNDDTPTGKVMHDLISELSLTGSFHFMGLRPDVHRLIPGFDVFCSSSVTEGFCNAICEGMACGVPCVVTDVGDSALIVEKTGIVVPPADPQKLADGIVSMLQLRPDERRLLGDAARRRIIERFTIQRMVVETEKVYERLLNDRG